MFVLDDRGGCGTWWKEEGKWEEIEGNRWRYKLNASDYIVNVEML